MWIGINMKKVILIISIVCLLPSFAFAYNFMPITDGAAADSAAATYSYENWPEDSESTIEDVSYVCIATNPIASGDETATSPNSLISGTSLTMTAVGDPGGMSGGTRYCDGVGDAFAFAGGAIPLAITGTSAYTIIVKVKTYPTLDVAGRWFAFYSPGSGEYIDLKGDGTGKLMCEIKDNDHAAEALTTANAMAADTEYYVVVSHDDSSGISWFGFIAGGAGSGNNGQPVYGGDFTSGDTKPFVNDFNNFPWDLDGQIKVIMGMEASEQQAYWEYVLMDDSVLIDSVTGP